MAVTSPVVLLIFNRPDTTRRVFEEVARARPSRLFVVADGPRTKAASDVQRCAAARAVVGRVDWPCEVQTLFADENLGCRRRVETGLDWVFAQVEEAIILEDDCLPDPSFFGFCEALLARYRDEDRVRMVSGMNYLEDRLDVAESYVFSRYFATWGWATWRRAWARYDRELSEWPGHKRSGALERLYTSPDAVSGMVRAFDDVHGGAVDSWDSRWFHTCLFDDGLAAVPRVNLVSNLGVSGTHARRMDENHFRPTFRLPSAPLHHPAEIEPDPRHDEPALRQIFGGRRGAGAGGRAIMRRLTPWLRRAWRSVAPAPPFSTRPDQGQMKPNERALVEASVVAARPRHCVELGTWRGGGSTFRVASALRQLDQDGTLYTYEVDREVLRAALAPPAPPTAALPVRRQIPCLP